MTEPEVREITGRVLWKLAEALHHVDTLRRLFDWFPPDPEPEVPEWNDLDKKAQEEWVFLAELLIKRLLGGSDYGTW
jgi:hypothetical protein